MKMLLFWKMNIAKLLAFAWISVTLQWKEVLGGAVDLTEKNINQTLGNNEIVFINFYVDWCRFSNLLAPIFDEAADEIMKEYEKHPGKVVMGKVNCDQETNLAKSFHVTKYPTLKIVRNGLPGRREYRSGRSTKAFKTYIQDELKDPINEFKDLKELSNLDDKKRIIIGYFDGKHIPHYETFRKVAMNLKDDCKFYGGFGTVSKAMHPPDQSIVAFRSDKALSNDDDETFKGDLSHFDELYKWAHEKCVPLVREITFENAEELTEEGLPFLILFHAPDDQESIKDYKDSIKEMLLGGKQNVLYLTADGKKFAHPLHHLGKGEKDLPLIAIDSFKHMYLFPEFKLIKKPGKLKSFLEDLYSGKLHREFHYGPETPSQEDTKPSEAAGGSTSPPESTFKKLKPSSNRYTLLRDEL